MDLPPQLRQLRDFYFQAVRSLPPERDFVHAASLIERPAFFTLEHLRTSLNSPLLMPGYIALYWQGKEVDCSKAVASKFIKQGTEIAFLNKGIIEEYLARGASLVLEGLDILDPSINALCAALDSAHDCAFSNSVAFFSQRGNEAYRGHFDTQDVLAVHLAGEKRWVIHERQAPHLHDQNDLPPEKMGRAQAEIVMRPGDALFMRAFVPHQVQTTAEYSLHMSFDVCDRQVPLQAALGLVMEQYGRDATACYAPPADVMQKAMAHASSEAFTRRLAQLQSDHKRSYQYARQLLASNRVKALDRWIAAEQAQRSTT
jgi:hypothetical protein